MYVNLSLQADKLLCATGINPVKKNDELNVELLQYVLQLIQSFAQLILLNNVF